MVSKKSGPEMVAEIITTLPDVKDKLEQLSNVYFQAANQADTPDAYKRILNEMGQKAIDLGITMARALRQQPPLT